MLKTPTDIIVFNNTSVPAGTNVKSTVIINWNQVKPHGFVGLGFKITGDGTCDLNYEVEAWEDEWVVPTDASPIIVEQTSGNYKYITFGPDISTKMRITATETGATDAVTVNARLVLG